MFIISTTYHMFLPGYGLRHIGLSRPAKLRRCWGLQALRPRDGVHFGASARALLQHQQRRASCTWSRSELRASWGARRTQSLHREVGAGGRQWVELNEPLRGKLHVLRRRVLMIAEEVVHHTPHVPILPTSAVPCRASLVD